MARTRSWFPSALVCGLFALLACSGTEPTDGFGARPDLVYAQQDQRTGLWSVEGYREGLGSYTVVPGHNHAPRPAGPEMIMRPTTGELLYVAEGPGNQRYVLVDPISGKFSWPLLPGFVRSWSPSGDLLTTETVDGLQLVTLDGAVHSTLCSDTFICEAINWTPAGDAVVVARRLTTELYDLWLVPADGGAATALTQTEDSSEYAASLSPDGRYLAYTSIERHETEGRHQLWLAGADGSDPRLLITPANPGNLPWSPDGSSLAVYASVAGSSGLVIVPVIGEPTLMWPNQALRVPSEIDWSPDGNRLAYTAYDTTVSNVPGVFLINRDGTAGRLVNRPDHSAGSPHWLPYQPEPALRNK